MNILVLTSSRADYGIYLPLLKRLNSDDFFQLKLLVFGTHLSRFYGYTVDQIEQDGFEICESVETLILGDSEEAVCNAIGNTITKFSSIWKRLKDEFDLVLALGDRYEMFAAVTAAVPFNIDFAHFHGGETTQGAIDNIFRHAITHMSKYHFTATQSYKERVESLVQCEDNVFVTGSLSLDNIRDYDLYTTSRFLDLYGIDMNLPTILVTFHPETVSVNQNINYADTLVRVFNKLIKKYQIVITMPNADTLGSLIRDRFLHLAENNDRVIAVENFGSLGYFSCMSHAAFLLGNTSSGIIEAASLNKFVINLGDRQKGRERSNNIIDVSIDETSILTAVAEVAKRDHEAITNVYQNNDYASNLVVKKLKYIYNEK